VILFICLAASNMMANQIIHWMLWWKIIAANFPFLQLN
jgi:hypothetical protein